MNWNLADQSSGGLKQLTLKYEKTPRQPAMCKSQEKQCSYSLDLVTLGKLEVVYPKAPHSHLPPCW